MKNFLLFFLLIICLFSCTDKAREMRVIGNSYLAIQSSNRDRLEKLSHLFDHRKSRNQYFPGADTARFQKMLAVCSSVQASLDSGYQVLFSENVNFENEPLKKLDPDQKNRLSHLLNILQTDFKKFERFGAITSAPGNQVNKVAQTPNGKQQLKTILQKENSVSSFLLLLSSSAANLSRNISSLEKMQNSFLPEPAKLPIKPFISAYTEEVIAGTPYQARAILTTLNVQPKPVIWKEKTAVTDYSYQAKNGKLNLVSMTGPFAEFSFKADAFPVVNMEKPYLERRRIELKGTGPFSGMIGTDPAFSWYGPPPGKVNVQYTFDYFVDTRCRK